MCIRDRSYSPDHIAPTSTGPRAYVTAPTSSYLSSSGFALSYCSTTDPPAYRFKPDKISVPNEGLILIVAS